MWYATLKNRKNFKYLRLFKRMDSFWASHVFVKLFYTGDLVMELHCIFHFFPLYYNTKLDYVKHLKQKKLG